ncbi:ABC transporter permease [Microbacterium lacticum]
MSDALTIQMAQADVQVAIDENVATGDVTPTVEAALNTVRSIPEVEAADAQQSVYVPIAHGDRRTNGSIEALLSDPLRWQNLAEGSWPAATGEGVIDESSARILGVAIGDLLHLPSATHQSAPIDIRIVGIIGATNTGFARGTPTVLVSDDTLRSIDGVLATSGILVHGVTGVTPEELAQNIKVHIGADPSLLVLTRAEAVDRQLAQLSGSSSVLTSLLLVFAAIALLVAGFVIANTFRVLVAQRTRDLALLRCVGASRAQVYRMIVAEAGIVGVVFSALGAVLGIAASTSLVALSNSSGSGIALNGVTIPPAVLPGSVLAGTAVTVLFALSPARNATAVRPVAALRPIDVDSGARRPIISIVLGLLVGTGGAIGLILGANSGTIPVTLASGVIAVLGILWLSASLLPPAIHLTGRAVSWLSAAVQLAVSNTGRNRSRTAATGAALLIGSILLAMLTTGITSSRESLMAQIDDRRPFDLIVRTTDSGAIPPELIETIRAIDGITASAPALTGTVTLTAPGRPGLQLDATGVDSSAMQTVAHSSVPLPQSNTIILNPADAQLVSESDEIMVSGSDGEADLAVVLAQSVDPGHVLLTTATLNTIDPNSVVGLLHLRLEAAMSADEVQRVTTDILSLSDRLDVYGGAPERAYYNQILDTLLLVVLALLAVAIVIAFVGIGNTAALSVIERRRESALLRAVGLARGQLVTMVCVEAALTAAVSVTGGLVIGVLFGWAGITAIGHSMSRLEMSLHVPWGQLVLILLSAMIASAGAAMLPAVVASRRKPVQDLAAA